MSTEIDIDIEIAAPTQVIEKAAPSKKIENKKVGIDEFVPQEKRRKLIDACAASQDVDILDIPVSLTSEENILDIPVSLKKQMDS